MPVKRRPARKQPQIKQTIDRIPLVINDWTAKRLEAEVGTELRVAYFEPEVENGEEVERYFDAVVTEVVPITEPAKRYYRSRPAVFDQPPTVYNDPDLTPSVPGVTDQDSISDWDLPFRLEREIPKEDDRYWNEYRLTPKAFLPLADGYRLFGSRFGKTTGLRIDKSAAEDVEDLAAKVAAAVTPIAEELGWHIRPVKQQQLAASKGTTPFDALFLSLSFFVIFAAIMLIAMLFRLGLLQRLRQFGTLLAVGWTPKRVASLALKEGLLVAAIGVGLGVVGGVVYAKVVLWALTTLWVGAVTVPFLRFSLDFRSLVIGGLLGFLVAAITLWWTARSMLKVSAVRLLTGRDTDQPKGNQVAGETRSSKLPMIAGITALFAVIAAAAGASVGGQAAAGGFVGGGMLLLIAVLMSVYAKLRSPRRVGEADQSLSHFSIGALASRNASRHPLRSTLTIGLMATAAFLIIAISAFRLQPTNRGTGGFSLVATSAQPLFRDLNDRDVQSDTLGPDADALGNASVASMRVRPGQDASCNNLYRASQPTVLGIKPDFGDGCGRLCSSIGLPSNSWDEGESPWSLLRHPSRRHPGKSNSR